MSDNKVKMRIAWLIFLLTLWIKPSAFAGGSPSLISESQAHLADTLDRAHIQAQYADGNLDTVVIIINDYRAKHNKYRRVDSVVVAKYLGVVFSSNPDSREKGKYWLYKMLELNSRENLVDLYVGENVEHIFEKVREEFMMRRNYQGVNDTKLTKAVQSDIEPSKRDTIVRRDTIVLKGDNWASPITDVVKDGLSEVKGGIKAGIQGGYVAVKEEPTNKDFPWTGNINVGAGIKYLDQEWEVQGFTDETEFRLAFDIRQRKWPINIAVDVIYDQSSDIFKDLDTNKVGTSKLNLTTYEFNVGVRKIFDFKLYSVRPFVGGGFGRIQTQQNSSGVIRKESLNAGKISYWLNAGVYWELNRHFNIGLEMLSSHAKIDLLGIRNHGGTHVDMLLGFHF